MSFFSGGSTTSYGTQGSAFGTPIGGGAFGGGYGASAAPPLLDSPVQQGLPSDSISALSWSPMANFFAAASWDKMVRVWDVQPGANNQANALGKAMKEFEQPVLSACWSSDGTSVFAAGCDKKVSRWDLGSDQVVQVGGHDAPVRSIAWSNAPQPLIVSGSWDRTLRFWDPRSPKQVHQHQLPERCYGLSVRNNLLVAATAGNYVDIINLTNPTVLFRRLGLPPPGQPQPKQEDLCPLKEQIRCVACVADGEGFLIGSAEGRAASYYIDDPKRDSAVSTDDTQKAKSFSFKCHRFDRPVNAGQTSMIDVFAVNAIAPHPREIHSLVTGGSDGCYQFWEKQERRKISSGTIMEPDTRATSNAAKSTPVRGNNLPITAMEFNADGSLLAYAHSYDWSKGHAYNNPAATDPREKPAIFIRIVQPQDLKAPPSTAAPGRR